MTTELTKAAQQALEALKHGVAQLNGIGIPLEADPLHTAIAALERALTQRPAAQTLSHDETHDWGDRIAKLQRPASLSTAQQATPEPVPADQAKWCKYVAGMVDCWVSAEWPHYNHMDEDRRVKAIAGIIERRLWALQKQAAATPEPVGEAIIGRWLYEKWWAEYGKLADVDKPYYTFDELPEKQRAAYESLALMLTRPAPGVPDGFALVPMTEDQVWHNDSIMSANAIGGLKMEAVMRIVRGVEAHHSERLTARMNGG